MQYLPAVSLPPYMEWASYTRTLSMIGMPRTSDSASSRLSAFRMQ